MFGNEGWYTLGALPPSAKFQAIKSPDACPSFSRIECEARGKNVLEVLEVKGPTGEPIGAIVLAARGDDATGRLSVHGVCIFTTEEIRYAR